MQDNKRSQQILFEERISRDGFSRIEDGDLFHPPAQFNLNPNVSATKYVFNDGQQVRYVDLLQLRDDAVTEVKGLPAVHHFVPGKYEVLVPLQEFLEGTSDTDTLAYLRTEGEFQEARQADRAAEAKLWARKAFDTFNEQLKIAGFAAASEADTTKIGARLNFLLRVGQREAPEMKVYSRREESGKTTFVATVLPSEEFLRSKSDITLALLSSPKDSEKISYAGAITLADFVAGRAREPVHDYRKLSVARVIVALNYLLGVTNLRPLPRMGSKPEEFGNG